MEDWRVGVVGGTFFIEVGVILSLCMGDLNVRTHFYSHFYYFILAFENISYQLILDEDGLQ